METFNEKKTEKSEAELLSGKSFYFDIERKIKLRVPGFLGYLGKKYTKTETQRFEISEPTLSTLDRIAVEQIDLEIDEKVLSSNEGMQHARAMAHTYSKKLAKILAITVLGTDYIIQIQDGKRTKYVKDDERLNELTELFFNNIEPSKLLQYVIGINTMSNLPDFINSIRLMSAARTTMPNRVEVNNED